jgi:hypothetical protein
VRATRLQILGKDNARSKRKDKEALREKAHDASGLSATRIMTVEEKNTANLDV